MKKKVLLISALSILGLGGLALSINSTINLVKAEEEEIVSSEETSVDSSEIVSISSEESVESVEPSEPAEPVEDTDYVEEIKAFMSKYIDSALVANIITWLTETGIMSALVVVWAKYSKYKSKTVDEMIDVFKNEIDGYLKESFDKLSEGEIKNIINNIDKLEESNETIMKVLVLMQDTSTKGKAALIDFLGSKTSSKEIKEASEEVAKALEKEQEKADEINSAVAGEYKEIF